MRILLLAPHPFFQTRGTPIAERALIEFLCEAGHEVDVLTFPEGEDLHIPGCRIRRIPALPGLRGVKPGFSVRKVIGDAAMAVALGRLLSRERYDLIHAVEESAFLAVLARRLWRVPFVYDMDSSLPQQLVESRPMLRPLAGWLDGWERAAVRESVGVLAVCDALVTRARGYDRHKLVACVEDTTLLGGPEGDAAEPLAEPREPLVVYVGNLERYQGIDLLLESFAEARRRVPPARLVIVGGKPADIEHYTVRARNLGLAGAVRFTGPRPVEQLGSILRQADLLVSPRLTGTNTPMKIYSYLDAGVAVLATRLPTHTQVLDDDIAALAEPGPVEFGDAMAGLLLDPERRRALAARAAARVRERYTPEAARRKLVRFYEAVERMLAVPRAA